MRDSTSSPRTSRIVTTLSYYVAFISLGLVGAALGPSLPYLAQQTGSQLSQVSLLFTAFSLGYLLGSYQGGHTYDRVPGHRVMAAALIVMAAMLALIPLVPWLWLLAAVWLVLGLAAGALDVGGNTLLVWVHGDRVGPFMNGLHFIWGVGALLSPLVIARAIGLTGGLVGAFWVLAALMLPGVIGLLRLASPNHERAAEDGPGKQNHHLLVALGVLFFFLNVGAEASFGGWIFTYAMTMDLGDATTAAYLTSGFWGALTLGRLLAVPISARVRPRYILVGSLLACLAGLAVILLWPGSAAALWSGTLGMGLGMASIVPSTLSLVGRHVPISGRITGWFFVGASAGGMSLPWLIGQLFESSGPRASMVTITLAMLASAVAFAALLTYLARPAIKSEVPNAAI
jgi:fucose permease